MPSLVPISSRLRAGLALAALAFALTACSSSTGKWGFPYRAPVQQGNWITQEQVALLQVGMTREQVRFALGSPTLTSVLHADRWDYPYYYVPGRGAAQERKFTVWFDNERLARWQGDDQPDIQPFQQQAREEATRVRREDRETARVEKDEADADKQPSTPSPSGRSTLSIQQNPMLPSPAQSQRTGSGGAEPLR
ncbi:Outer membrane lipoprotein SmpA, a component of the essential YaeT outer-membrane protein assembly complex [plant metagenome]|uniref:Outer membrane lipoprotein SmpA, a component of the essential YaeT outer-membrane protein assembly complex n=1 Tax=plant metagenome TaxID=1297885 RepID=A0A484TQ56_9ZZZZ